MSLVAKIEKFFRTSQDPVLFAGAGVSVRAGLPTWREYIGRIAHQANEFDPLTTQIMQARLNEGDLLTAADLYFLCHKIPENRKQQIMVKPFEEYDSSLILPLVNLPFQKIVTTNYDRCLFDAYATAHKTSPREVNLNDPTLRSAPYESNLYIARIHGRIEIPESMILSGRQFAALQEHNDYNSFLMHIFSRKQVLFVGFSFLDPAIKAVFTSIQQNIGACHEGTHVALVPHGSRPDLVSQLAKFNIETLFYPSNGDHDELWSVFSSVSYTPNPDVDSQEIRHEPFDRVRRYLATAYARNRLGAKRKPLRHAILEGMVAEILRRQPDMYVQPDAVVDALHDELHLRKEMIRNLVHTALDRLTEDNLCSKNVSPTMSYKWEEREDTYFENAITELVNGVITRYIVRQGGRETEDVRNCIDEMIRNLLLFRGWDLGVSFASRKVPDGVDFYFILENTTACDCFSTSIESRRIVESVRDMCQKPDSKQSELLYELGRLSFGLELVLEAPRDTLLHALTLPERIYLDTNIILPAIVPNHPFHDLYNRAINRLLEAAAESMLRMELVISRDFVEEIIGHRNIAVREYELMQPNMIEELKKDVVLYGSRNINVYLSGYINSNDIRNNPDMDFMEFLNKYAPYSNIAELKGWLAKKGISVVNKHDLIAGDDSYPKILHAMEIEFSDLITRRVRTAEVVAHDAMQLAGLNKDYKAGRRSIFVTADRQLREFVSSSRYAYLGNAIVSNTGLVQLVDLLIGEDFDPKGFVTLIWSSKVSSKSEQIRGFLIDRALESYDQAMAMEMPNLIDQVTESILGTSDMDLNWESSNPKERAKIRKYIDGFEDEYYEGMRESIERKEKQGW